MTRGHRLKDDELAGRMGLQLKEVSKIMAVLEKDRLVQVHRQNELKEGAQRSVGRQYFFLDFKHFCNVVKWRIAEMHHTIDSRLRNELDNKGYVCPQCKRQYTPLQADRLIDLTRGALICEICHGELVDNENDENVRGSQDRMQRFNYQMRFILEGLRKSEEMVMPAFDVSLYISKQFAEAAASQNGTGESGLGGLKIAGSSGSRAPDAGVGVMLSVDKDAETIRREREEEAAARRQQNALPAWHLKSTISGDLTALGIKESAREAEISAVALKMQGDEILVGLGRAGPAVVQTNGNSHGSIPSVVGDVKPVIRTEPEADMYDQYYASLAASAAPTPSFSASVSTPNDEEARSQFSDASGLRKRSRSIDDDGDAARKMARMDEDTGINGEDDPTVYVNGAPMPFSRITEEDQERMTPEEYTAYFEVFQTRSSF